MKKLIIIFLAISFLFSMVSCLKDTTGVNSSDQKTDNTIANTSSAEGNATEENDLEAWMEVAIPELNISNATIHQLENISFDKNKSDFTVVLLNNNFDGRLYPFIPMVILKDNDSGKLLTYKPINDECAYSQQCYFRDVDGDNYPEIIIQICVEISGGAGGYTQSVLKYTDGKLTDLMNEDFDSGFHGELQDGYKLKITNRFTQYENTILFLKGEYQGVYYNNDGKVEDNFKDSLILVDSFYSFKPFDIDKDGIFEIQTKQYTSLFGHSDFIGSACSILKYDKKISSFKVVQSKFLAYTYNWDYDELWEE